MNKRTLHKILSIVLSIGMVFSVAYAPTGVSFAADSDSEWTKLADIDAAVQTEKSVAITMTASDGTVYALPSGKTSASPAATVATAGEKLSIPGTESSYGWKITKNSDGTYNIANSGGDVLYLTKENAGVRVGNKPDTGADFSITDGFLTAKAPDATRYVGVYLTKPDWRCYTSINNNIKGQTLNFWEFDTAGEPSGPEEPEVTVSTIQEALAGANNEEFTVKGVVTLVDGKNIYIQDETGGIDLYFGSAPSGISLGDTLIGTGKRATYNGLPELGGATFEKVTAAGETLELKAKETTIGALSTKDICTYVSIKDLEVTEVYDNNGQYSNPNITVKDAEGKTIQIYKAVIGKTGGAWDVAQGDTIDVTLAVGYSNKYQLRNTIASEIKVSSAEEPETYTVTADPAENGRVSLSKTEAAEGEEVVITL